MRLTDFKRFVKFSKEFLESLDAKFDKKKALIVPPMEAELKYK